MFQLTFRVKHKTAFGQNLCVVGNQEFLGNWSPTLAPSMRCEGDDLWQSPVFTLRSPLASTELEYKYLVREEHSSNVVWEWTKNRVFSFPKHEGIAGAYFHMILEDAFNVERPSVITIIPVAATPTTQQTNQPRTQISTQEPPGGFRRYSPCASTSVSSPSLSSSASHSTLPSPTVDLLLSPSSSNSSSSSSRVTPASLVSSAHVTSATPSPYSMTAPEIQLQRDVYSPMSQQLQTEGRAPPQRKGSRGAARALQFSANTSADLPLVHRPQVALDPHGGNVLKFKVPSPETPRLASSGRNQVVPPIDFNIEANTDSASPPGDTFPDSENHVLRRVPVAHDLTIYSEDKNHINNQKHSTTESNDPTNGIQAQRSQSMFELPADTVTLPEKSGTAPQISEHSNFSVTFGSPFSKPPPVSQAHRNKLVENFIEQVANNDLEIFPTNPLLQREAITAQSGFFNKFIMALQHNTTITQIIYPAARTTELSKAKVIEFTTALRRANSIGRVTAITLSVSVCGEKVAEAFRAHAHRLERVAIKWCPLSLEMAQAWAEYIRTTVKLRYLTINVGREGVDNDTCGMLIAEALERNRSVEVAKLRSNDFGEKTALQFSRVLRANTTLTYLDLSHNNLGHEGFQTLFKALSSSVLKTLILKDCEIDENSVKRLADSLRTNTSLTTLSLFSNRLGGTGAKHLAEALAKNGTLKHLDLYANNAGNHGAEELARMLRLNVGLSHLSLQNNGINQLGVQAIAEALHGNTTLKILNLAVNTVGSSEQALCRMLSLNSTLVKLDLRFTDAMRNNIENAITNRKQPLELVWLY